LYFLRHAKAQDRHELRPDIERTLTEKGRQQALQVGRWLLQKQLSPELTLTSPYPRALQTAALCVQAAAGYSAAQEQAWLAHGNSLHDQKTALLSLLPTLPNHTLLVGHEPEFSTLLADLLASSPASLQIRKASLWCIEVKWQQTTPVFCLQWSLPVQLMG